MDYEPAQLVFIDNTLETRLKKKHKRPVQQNGKQVKKTNSKPPKARIGQKTNPEYSRKYYALHKEEIRAKERERDHARRDKNLAEGLPSRHQIYRERKRTEKLASMNEEEKKIYFEKKEKRKPVEGESKLERRRRLNREFYARNKDRILEKQNEVRRLGKDKINAKQNEIRRLGREALISSSV
jgi:hypothetical protein